MLILEGGCLAAWDVAAPAPINLMRVLDPEPTGEFKHEAQANRVVERKRSSAGHPCGYGIRVANSDTDRVQWRIQPIAPDREAEAGRRLDQGVRGQVRQISRHGPPLVPEDGIGDG